MFSTKTTIYEKISKAIASAIVSVIVVLRAATRVAAVDLVAISAIKASSTSRITSTSALTVPLIYVILPRLL